MSGIVGGSSRPDDMACFYNDTISQSFIVYCKWVENVSIYFYGHNIFFELILYCHDLHSDLFICVVLLLLLLLFFYFFFVLLLSLLCT